MDLQVAIVIWLLCGIAALLIAQARHAARPVGWFVWGVIFGPFGLLYAILSAGPDEEW